MNVIFELFDNLTNEAKIIVYTIEESRRSRPDAPNKPIISKSSIETNKLTINWKINSENYGPVRFYTIQINEVYFKNKIDNNLNNYLIKDFEKIINNTETNYYNFDLNWRTIYKYKITNSYNLNNFLINEFHCCLPLKKNLINNL